MSLFQKISVQCCSSVCFWFLVFFHHQINVLYQFLFNADSNSNSISFSWNNFLEMNYDKMQYAHWFYGGRNIFSVWVGLVLRFCRKKQTTECAFPKTRNGDMQLRRTMCYQQVCFLFQHVNFVFGSSNWFPSKQNTNRFQPYRNFNRKLLFENEITFFRVAIIFLGLRFFSLCQIAHRIRKDTKIIFGAIF